jgi:hypothetical protein
MSRCGRGQLAPHGPGACQLAGTQNGGGRQVLGARARNRWGVASVSSAREGLRLGLAKFRPMAAKWMLGGRELCLGAGQGPSGRAGGAHGIAMVGVISSKQQHTCGVVGVQAKQQAADAFEPSMPWQWLKLLCPCHNGPLSYRARLAKYLHKHGLELWAFWIHNCCVCHWLCPGVPLGRLKRSLSVQPLTTATERAGISWRVIQRQSSRRLQPRTQSLLASCWGQAVSVSQHLHDRGE